MIFIPTYIIHHHNHKNILLIIDICRWIHF